MPKRQQSRTVTAYEVFETELERARTELFSTYQECASDSEFIEKKPATEFVLNWMGEHVRSLKRFNESISRHVLPSSADQLTGAVAVALQEYLAHSGSTLLVESEKFVATLEGRLRPDITIWATTGELVALIECKTQLGYSRSSWQQQYFERTDRIKLKYPNALSFLVILTGLNWDVSEYLSSDQRKSVWFCMSSVWPDQLIHPFENQLIDPIETLLISIRDSAT